MLSSGISKRQWILVRSFKHSQPFWLQREVTKIPELGSGRYGHSHEILTLACRAVCFCRKVYARIQAKLLLLSETSSLNFFPWALEPKEKMLSIRPKMMPPRVRKMAPMTWKIWIQAQANVFCL